MADTPDCILIYIADADEAALTPTGARRGLGDKVTGAAAKASEVSVSTLQENMRRFLSGLDSIISTSPKSIGGLTLDEVEIHAQIDSRGNVGICGFAGAEVAAQGGIRFVLRKKV